MGTSSNTSQTLSAKGLSLGIVVSRYNEVVCEGLLKGALQELARLGLEASEVLVERVPGAFELPIMAKSLVQKQNLEGVICLGAVIQGESSHFDYVCQGVTAGVMQVMLETNTPVGFGVLTTDNEAQALARSAANSHNKGAEAARTVVEMVLLQKKLNHGYSSKS